jgi:hypothetical protein
MPVPCQSGGKKPDLKNAFVICRKIENSILVLYGSNVNEYGYNVNESSFGLAVYEFGDIKVAFRRKMRVIKIK